MYTTEIHRVTDAQDYPDFAMARGAFISARAAYVGDPTAAS